MQSTRERLLLSLALAAALGAAGCATHRWAEPPNTSVVGAAKAPGQLETVDLAFATTAAFNGLYEVEISKLAASRATNAQVRNYAQMLVSHHSAANNELMALLRSKASPVPTGLAPDKQARIAQLAALSGAEFDRQFIRMVGIQDHQSDISVFEQAGRTAADRDLRAWANKTLPTLRQHLQQAQGIAGTMAG